MYDNSHHFSFSNTNTGGVLVQTEEPFCFFYSSITICTLDHYGKLHDGVVTSLLLQTLFEMSFLCASGDLQLFFDCNAGKGAFTYTIESSPAGTKTFCSLYTGDKLHIWNVSCIFFRSAPSLMT